MVRPFSAAQASVEIIDNPPPVRDKLRLVVEFDDLIAVPNLSNRIVGERAVDRDRRGRLLQNAFWYRSNRIRMRNLLRRFTIQNGLDGSDCWRPWHLRGRHSDAFIGFSAMTMVSGIPADLAMVWLPVPLSQTDFHNSP